MKYIISFIAILLLLSTHSLFAQKPAQTIPAFTFYRLNGTPFTHANIVGNKTIFFFYFDPGCDHCQHAAANINQHYTEYVATQFYMVSVSDKSTILRFINQFAPALNNKENVLVLQDTQNEFLTRFQPLRYPGMFLYSADKKLLDYEDNEASMFRFLTVFKKLTHSAKNNL